MKHIEAMEWGVAFALALIGIVVVADAIGLLAVYAILGAGLLAGIYAAGRLILLILGRDEFS